MNEKVKVIILTIVFVALLIGLNIFMKMETNKKLYGDADINEYQNNKEETNMNIVKVNTENFEKEVLKSDKTVLIDFYADWCGPCKMLSPIIGKVAEENENLKVVKVNIDEAQDLAVKYDVMSIPTLVVIKEGKETNRSVGLISQNEVEKLIK